MAALLVCALKKVQKIAQRLRLLYMPSAAVDLDTSTLVLALKILGSFDFSGKCAGVCVRVVQCS